MASTSGRPSSPEGRGGSSSAAEADEPAALIGSGDAQAAQILGALKAGDVNCMKKLDKKLKKKRSSLLQAVAASGKDVPGRLLHLAARWVQFEACKYLITDLKMDVNRAGEQDPERGGTPLISAIDALDSTSATHKKKNCEKIVELLIRRGASPDQARTDGFAPIHAAVMKGSFEITKILLASGAEVNATCQFGMNVAVIKLLLERGVDPNSTNISGFTALHLAAIKDSFAITKYLLDNGADPSAICHNGSVLHIAAESGTGVDVVKLLLDQGIDPNIANISGFTALHVAASKDSHAIAELLLEYKAEVESVCDKGTPLHIATEAGACVKVVQLLLDNGANPNITNMSGLTALHIAAQKDAVDVAKLLLAEGAEINAVCQEGTPLHIAVVRGNMKLLTLLIKHDASANVSDMTGRKAIEVAALKACRESVEMLFPITSPIDKYTNWSVGAIMDHAKNA